VAGDERADGGGDLVGQRRIERLERGVDAGLAGHVA